MFKKIVFRLILILSVLSFLNPYAEAQTDVKKIDNIIVNLHNAYFQDFKVDNLNITTNYLDFNSNNISDLYIRIMGIHSKDLSLDELNLIFKNIYLDIKHLITKQDLSLKQPLYSNVTLIVAEKTLNQLINNPVILDKLSNLATTKITKLGLDIGSGMVTFKEPNIKILPNNTLRLDLLACLANAISYPVSLTTTLIVQDSRLVSVSPVLSAYGIAFPQIISQKLNDQINEIIDFKKKLGKNLDIKITSVQTVSKDKIIINAETTISKLKFGKLK